MLAARYRSQAVAYPYFAAAAALFLLQVLAGLVIAAQYVWPTFLIDTLPFNIGRATHLNLMVVWLLLGLMGAAYYLTPEETLSELWSPPLARVQLGVLLLAGVGALATMWLGGATLGKPFTEAPMPWPYVIALGAVMFLVNLGMTILRATRRSAIVVVLLSGMVALSGLYLINMVFFPNLAVDYFWWWWIIHLWVEGAWELIAAAIMAYLLIQLTGVDRARMHKWLYVEVALVTFTGTIGIGHHYYWIGTPGYWLMWGAIFSALEPVPLVLMVYDAFHSMHQRRATAANIVACYWVVASAIAHFLGAGVWGFAETLPQINRWVHGTLVTASHGHFAFYGAFAMLVFAAIAAMLPALGFSAPAARRAFVSFWLMNIGMAAIVLAFTFAGLVQVYLHRIVGMDFMVVRDGYVRFWMFWVWASGLVLFLPGAVLYAIDVLRPRVVPVSVSVETAAV